MNSKVWQTTVDDEQRSLKLAEDIGKRLKGGEVIELISDFGGGKTTFVRGLAKGMGVKSEAVKSPSFAIEHEYRAKGLTLHHYDFYRLDHPGDMKSQLAEVLQDKDNVVVVEWGLSVKDILPDSRLRIGITVTLKGENTRGYIINYPDGLSYLIPKAK